MKKPFKLILLALMGSITAVPAQTPAIITSDKTGWHKIAETTVDFKKEKDEVSVLISDRFASIQFRVIDAPIQLVSLEIFYESGDKQDIAVNSTIKSKGSSRIIDLNGGERSLKRIAFVYKTLPNSKDVKAHVEIWGLKTNTDEKITGEIKSNSTKTEESKSMGMPSLMVSDSKGWHKIGDRTVDFKIDKDVFNVIGADRFSAIKIKAIEASILISNLTVTYESGDVQYINFDTKIMAGTETKEIMLNGGERSLKTIAFEYKTIPNETATKAELEVWGLKTNLVTK